MSTPWITVVARAARYNIDHTRNAKRHHVYHDMPFYLHHHFLASYGLAALAYLEPRMSVAPFLLDYLPIKHTLLKHQERLIDTGPPEWWRQEPIHKSHRDFLKYNPSPGKKHDYGFIVKPERDIDQLLTNLQPILRAGK